MDDQQSVDAARVAHASPAAFFARQRSRTEFAGIDAAGAARVLHTAFPALVSQRDGGAPVLGHGETLTRYLSPTVGQIDLPGRKREVVESLSPMARPTSPGHFKPIDLALTSTGSGYTPVSSDIAVQIPKRIGAGVSASETGVSLTPVDATGKPLSGTDGKVDGAGVLYANTQTDSDVLAKPASIGFEISTILRSADSPRRLYYRVGLPAGASLVQQRPEDPVQVLSGRRVIAAVMPPSAQDASGTPTPVAMTVQGHTLVVELEGDSSESQYPIAVDPLVTTEDRSLTGGVFPVEKYKGGTRWLEFASSGSFHYEKHYSCATEWYWCEQWWYIEPRGPYGNGDFAGLRYETQGESRISKLEAWMEGENEPSEAHTQVEFLTKHSEVTNYAILSTGPRYTEEPLALCVHANSCESSSTDENNTVRIMDFPSKSESIYGLWMWVWDARVYVQQEKGPTASFNTTSPTIAGAENRPNVLYGSGSWLGPNSGALEASGVDKGIGVSFAAFSGDGMSQERFIRNEEGKCLGIQCSETYSSPLTYLSELYDGEHQIKFNAENAAGQLGYQYATVKVDGTKPNNLEVTGWPARRELGASPHTLTISASDPGPPPESEGPHSSGIKSVVVSVDGGSAVTISGAACSLGPCTGHGTYALNAESLSEGVHRLVVTATDNANNVAAKEWTFDVRHSSPEPLGPGSVDPTSGQFELGATDVSLGGISGVSRVYRSRNLTAGAEGPFGPQWAMGLGGSQSLTVLPEGSVVLTATNGGRTTFLRKSEGEGKFSFESPLGDENLKVETMEGEPGKGVTEYLVKDTTAGSTTHFIQPVGTESTAPVYANQFGSEGAGLETPISVATDASGNVWVTDYNNARVLKYSAAGVLQGSYGYHGPYGGSGFTPEFIGPWGVAVNQSTGNVYVSDQGNNRIVEMNSSGQFIRTFGWGVSDGKEEFEICERYCQAGLAGSNPGELHYVAGVAVDSSGNVWVADYGNNRIEEFKETGQYLQQFGTEGTGETQFKGPLNIAFSGGNLYINDYGNNRVQEFSSGGAPITRFTSCTGGPGSFSNPYGIAADPRTGNLYIADSNNSRVQECSASHAFIAKFGSAGSGNGQFSTMTGIAVNSAGGLYVNDYSNHRVQMWLRPSWLPSVAEGPQLAEGHPGVGTIYYAYTPVKVGESTVLEPGEVTAPTPMGVTCGTKPEELKKGCRALTFKYASTTTASGENRGQWGEYAGRLTRVYFHGWDPSKGSMSEPEVARYEYDTKGRLRAEWDPRIETSTDCGGSCAKLMTVYGYDAEGHLTALSAPAQETWAFTYGTIAGDANTGRLIKAMQPAAATTLWGGEAPTNTEAPKVSGSAAVGVRMGVSNGAWSHSPITYGYQWEDCNAEGKECSAILGANNANYTPVSSDVGHRLVAEVTAVNGGGSVLASSAASAVVVSSFVADEKQAIDASNSINAVSCVPSTTDCVVSDSAGKALYATNVSASAEASWKTWSGPSGQSPSQAVACPSTSLCLLADGKEAAGGKLYYATSLGGAFSEAYAPSYGVDAIACVSASFCIDGQDNFGYFRYSTSPASTSWTLEDQGTAAIKGTFCLSVSFCALADNKGIVHVANSTAQVESSTWKETDVDGTTALTGIACTSTSSCVAIDGAGNVINLTIESSGTAVASKHDVDGTNALSAVTCTGSTCVAVDNAGNVLVSTNKGETWTTQYKLSDKLTSVSCASTSLCAAADTTGNVIALSPTGGTPTEAEYHSPQPGLTVEYHVPRSGTGLPTLTAGEVERWGQKTEEAPVEGTAIIAPDEPMGWPASSYKRASIAYFDEEGRTVNQVSPTGGVSTTEYNEINEITRTLSADNRAAALNETTRSAQIARSKQLDTKNTYNASNGELQEALGPEHLVKLAGGTEVQAREHVRYFYDQGAPEGKSYGLTTEEVDGAQYEGKEADVHTTKTSYSGQENLGWKLRKPTSVTKDAGGLNSTTTTVYDPVTGDVKETRGPGGSGGSESSTPPVYASQFGSQGTKEGQFETPEGVAVDPTSGAIYVADYTLNRVEKFTASGVFASWVGSATSGSGEGQLSHPESVAVSVSGNVYVGDAGNHRVEEFNAEGKYVRAFGKEGTGEGQFGNAIYGLAFDANGKLWVSDGANHRVEKFSETGVFEKQYGEKGSGEGQLEEPRGVTVSAGNVYVVDTVNNRVLELTTEAKFVSQFGKYGLENGQLREPWGIAADSKGNLYVADRWPDRVEEFSPTGSFVAWLGSSGAGEGQFNDPDGLASDATGDLYVADQGNHRIQKWVPSAGGETVYPPVFASAFGGLGSGSGQFKEPCEVAFDSSGNVWVVDAENGRIQKWSSTGTFIASYGSKGAGNLQFSRPYGIAINQSTGNVYVGDYGNNRVEELSSSGTYVASFGTSGEGALKEPMGVKLDSSGNVYVVDRGHSRIVEFTSEGAYIRAFASAGSGNGQLKEPMGLAFSEGSLYVADFGNNRVEQFSSSGTYLGQFGTAGAGAGQFKEPFSVAANPSTGNLYVADLGNQRVDEFSPTGRFLTDWETWGPAHQLSSPIAVAVGAAGKLYVSDVNGGKVSTWTAPEAGAAKLTYTSQIGSGGTGGGQFTTPIGTTIDGEGNLWATDLGNNRIEKFSSSGAFIKTIGWGVSDGKSELEVCSSSCRAGLSGSGNGQFNGPGGIDVNQSTGNIYVADTYNARIEEFSSAGAFIAKFGTEGSGKLTKPGGVKIDSAGNVWVPDISANKIFEYSSTGSFLASYGKEGSGTGEVQFKKPIAVTLSGENLYIADSANHRVEEISNKGAFIRVFGTEGGGSGEMYDPEGIAADAAGNLYVTDSVAGHVEEFNANGGYMATFASKGSGEGQLKEPIGDTVDAAGSLYVVDMGNNRIEKWSSSNQVGSNQAAHYSKTIYYTAEGEAEVSACRNHPEWAGMPCQTEPVAQPGGSLPPLPITKTVYNLWDKEETTEETFGSTVRKKIETYDPAGRAVTSEETATPATDTALPKVTNEYSATTGALVKQSTTVEGKTTAVTSKLNNLGQLVEYTDAEGNVAKYVYEEGGDGRLMELSEGKGEEGSSKQTYSYDPTTGFMTKLIDSAAGTFTATYDPEGKTLTESYPDGLTATTTYNTLGSETGISYVKSAHCASTCPETWFSDTVVPSIHGETLKQTSTLSKESYSYDNLGRLTETQEIPTGKGCKSRLYEYDEGSNRTSQTTRESGTETCASSGGTIQNHTYDSANRLSDAGMGYETFNNITKLPAADAEGYELTTSYYVDGQVKTQAQNGETINYTYDPLGRTLETASEGKTSAKTVAHYAGPGEAVTWISEGSGKWTRNIPGLDGGLDGSQTSGGTIKLLIHDLQGNVVGEAALSETETKLLSTYNSTEFGVPNEGKAPPKYAWLGATGLATELNSGVSTQGGASYVPQIARDLQTAPVVPPGAFPNGPAGGTQDTATIPAAEYASAKAIDEQIYAEAEAARQKAREEEEARQLQQCREEGGCGSNLECEENAAWCSSEDPTHVYTWEQAIKIGNRLKSITSIAEYVDFLGEWGAKAVEIAEKSAEGIEDTVGIDFFFGWFQHASKELISCGKHALICRLSFDVWKIPLPAIDFEKFPPGLTTLNVELVNIFDSATIERCAGTVGRPLACTR